MIKKLRDHYLQNRVQKIDPDFLEFEERQALGEDLELILSLIDEDHKLPNPHNSILLYITGISDEFNFDTGRSHMFGGAPPDIDLDSSPLEYELLEEALVEYWGRDHVANIAAYGTIKPRGFVDDYFRVCGDKKGEKPTLKKKIPDDQFGKAPNLDKIRESYPQIDKKHSGFVEHLEVIENLIKKPGVHAGGLVISDFPITDYLPLMFKNDSASKRRYERVTQFDKDLVEKLGLLKFDILRIENLSICKKTVDLIKKRHDKNIDIWSIPDGDEKTYEMMHRGLLQGVFQMETSDLAAQYIREIKPTSIEQLSDINALNRPGPQQAGLDEAYIKGLKSGEIITGLHPLAKEITKDTWGCIIYQEQLMKIASEAAQFSLREADDLRRVVGKKKEKEIPKYEQKFLDGCEATGLTTQEAEELWDTFVGFADYGFNKCLSGSTKIQVPDGVKPIHQIETDDLVRISNPSGKNQWAPVAKLIVNPLTAMYYVRFSTGDYIYATEDHKFVCTDGSERTIYDIALNNHSIKNIDSSTPAIKIANAQSLVKDIEQKEWTMYNKTYTLHVDHPVHNYVLANGAVSKNSHSVAYSVLTYVTAWLKAHYPLEFFTALLTVRSQTMQPKKWARKVPGFVQNAKALGIHINAPDINRSAHRFTIDGNHIWFGLAGIRGVGAKSAKAIMKRRGKTPYKNVIDFVMRVNMRKVNTGTFKSLVKAGAFDRMGYDRQELLDNADIIYDYPRALDAYEERKVRVKEREQYLKEVEPIIERRNELRRIKRLKTTRDLTEAEEAYIEEHKDVKRLPKLTLGELPEPPTIPRYESISLSLQDVLDQGHYLGCYLTIHPTQLVNTKAQSLKEISGHGPIWIGDTARFCVVIDSVKKIKTRKGQPMCFLQVSDHSDEAEVIVFPSVFKKLVKNDVTLENGMIIKLKGKIDEDNPNKKIIAFFMDAYER